MLRHGRARQNIKGGRLSARRKRRGPKSKAPVSKTGEHLPRGTKLRTTDVKSHLMKNAGE